MRSAFLLLLLAATPLHAEDVVHRADRRRTEALNRAAADRIDRRDAANDAVLARNRADRARYDRAMADWRRRVAACTAGEDSACAQR